MTDDLQDHDAELDREECAIYVISMIALAPVVVAALIRGGGVAIDSGETIGMLIVALGLIGLVAAVREPRAPVPRARARSTCRRRPSPNSPRSRSRTS